MTCFFADYDKIELKPKQMDKRHPALVPVEEKKQGEVGLEVIRSEVLGLKQISH